MKEKGRAWVRPFSLRQKFFFCIHASAHQALALSYLPD